MRVKASALNFKDITQFSAAKKNQKDTSSNKIGMLNFKDLSPIANAADKILSTVGNNIDTYA